LRELDARNVETGIALKSPSPILHGLREIAERYDALVCDVWGVVHNGAQAHLDSCDALRRFRRLHGPVALLTNAPRPLGDLLLQFERLGVPSDCYDEIVTSGMATRADLAQRAEGCAVSLFHLGPERDRGVFDGLPIACTKAADASLVLCTGLFDDETETPDDYKPLLMEFQARSLQLLCANPDIVVQRGGKLVYCAGAVAAVYESLGGKVTYYGKPHRPIYDLTLASLKGAEKPLAIGDGLHTDIRGANGAGLDALFIADGIHGEEIEPFTPEHLRSLFDRAGVHACASMRTLVW
jgi:HAD superfamily hydrolase (TIGR01459 family)